LELLDGGRQVLDPLVELLERRANAFGQLHAVRTVEPGRQAAQHGILVRAVACPADTLLNLGLVLLDCQIRFLRFPRSRSVDRTAAGSAEWAQAPGVHGARRRRR